MSISWDLWAERLTRMQAEIRDRVVAGRDQVGLHEVERVTDADTIYKIDAEVEPILERHCKEWASGDPLVLVAEGMIGDDGREGVKVYPLGAKESDAKFRIIADPIDGTRGIMYDKRAAWSLAAVAEDRGAGTRLSDVRVSVMTELPTAKMGFADVLSAVRGQGTRARRVDLRSGEVVPLTIRPSSAGGIDHGFASITNFFPATKVLSSEAIEYLVARLIPTGDSTLGTVFDDQYICTGGQFYELIIGHDRFNADLRPEFYRIQGRTEGMCCHPYDCAGLLIAEESGVVITDGWGRPLDGPMDCLTPMTWVGYANAHLRERIEPLVIEFLKGKGLSPAE